jgi:photosystem II stability/assembly factor-like uncharacterized protein
MKKKYYKFTIIMLSFAIIFLNSQNAFSQFLEELNSGITTELTSSSNCRIQSYSVYWQGWACGVNGTVIRSSNIQSQWLNVSGNGIPNTISLDNICGIDSINALVAGHINSSTGVWKTTNGGQNWTLVFRQPNGRINAVWMKNYLQGFMQGNPVGGRWSLWKTTNGGVNWDSSGLYLQQDSNETGWPNSLCIPMGQFFPPDDTNKIWFGTNNYRIYYSSNYGRSWNIQSTSPEKNIYCIAYGGMFQDMTSYAGGSNNLFKSTDDGTTWTLDSVGGTGNITGVTFCYYSFFLTRGNIMYMHSYYGGWYPMHTAPAGEYNYLDNRGFGFWWEHFGVRTNGGITFIADGEEVKKISSIIPGGYSLSQNYPNPFNPKSKIKFDIAKLGEVKLIIYDVLGREVATIVNKELQPGTYEAEWDGSNYSSGVYFYKLITAGFTETRKMVLVK